MSGHKPFKRLRDEIEADPERLQRLEKLFAQWLADESGYDEETWPELKAALDEDRPSRRKLFEE